MKKIFVVLLGVTFMASCNRDSSNTDIQGGTLTSQEAGLIHFVPSQLEKDFTPMTESTNLSGKTGSQLNYTFRGYANPVEIGGTELAASAVFQVDDMIFVAWHTNDYGNPGLPNGTVSGSLCAYRLSGIGQYELKDRVDFEKHDLYGVSAYRNNETGNIEVMVTGQRNTDDSQYTLSGHKGAIVARMDYDYINDEFWEESLMELPLTGVAGTGIVALGAQYFVTTGDGRGGATAAGTSGLFQVDRSLRNVIAFDAGITDAIDIEVDPRLVTPTGGEFYVLDRTADAAPNVNVLVKKFSFGFGGLSNLGTIATNGDHFYDDGGDGAGPLGPDAWVRDLNNDIAPVDYSKGHLVIAQGKKFAGLPNGTQHLDSMIVNYGTRNGAAGGFVYKARGGQNAAGATPTAPNIMDRSMAMGNFSAVTFDPSLGVLYCGGGDNGASQTRLKVIAMGEYASDKAFVNTHDLVGELTLPSSISTVGGGSITLNDKNINDISVYQTRHLAVSLGDNGLMFIQRNH
jgi:hypothetical protein